MFSSRVSGQLATCMVRENETTTAHNQPNGLVMQIGLNAVKFEHS